MEKIKQTKAQLISEAESLDIKVSKSMKKEDIEKEIQKKKSEKPAVGRSRGGEY